MPERPRILPPHPGRRLAPGLTIFLRTFLCLTAACAVAEVYSANVLHWAAPYNYPFFSPTESFWDFILFFPRFQHFGRSDFFTVDPQHPFLYPAPMAIVVRAFYLFRPNPLAFFFLILFASVAASAFILGRALHGAGASTARTIGFVAVSICLSYPLWFEYRQANLEIVVWVFVAAGVWAFCKGRGYSAAASFGIAGAMKIYPLIYLALSLGRRRFREALLGVATAAAATLVSLRMLGPHIGYNWRQIQHGLDLFRTTYALQFRYWEIGFDHSLFAVYKRIAIPLPPPETLAPRLTAYLCLAAGGGIVLYFVRIRRLPLINQVLCLSVASILLPPVSYDYTLLHLYIPWAMFAVYAQERFSVGERVRGLTAAFICLAILLAPESEVIIDSERIGGQVKAGALCALLYIGIRYPFEGAAGRPCALKHAESGHSW